MPRTKRPSRTSQEIGEGIAKLETERAKALAAEKADVIAKMKVAVAHYGITAADMGFAPAGKGAGKAKDGVKPKAKTKTPAPAKYKDDAGN